MYLSTALIIASLSFFVQATTASRSGFAIPLTRRSEFRDADGVVDMARLQLSVSHSIKLDFLTITTANHLLQSMFF